mgnify:CR=1 FL=1
MTLGVTDHAVIRYLERIEGMNIEKIRSDIRSKIKDMVKVCGDGRYPLGDRFQAVVENRMVITVIDRNRFDGEN